MQCSKTASLSAWTCNISARTQTVPIETRRTYFLLRSGKFDCFQVIGKDVGKLRSRYPPKTAICAEAERWQMFARRSDSFFEASHVVNCSKIDARTLRLQFIERGEKGVIGAIEDRNVDPINAATRRSDEAVGKFYQLAEIVGLEPRPSTECPKTEMIAKRDIWWDMRREVSDLGEVSLDGSFNRISGNAAVRILFGALGQVSEGGVPIQSDTVRRVLLAAAMARA
jgi:hypothetical protein